MTEPPVDPNNVLSLPETSTASTVLQPMVISDAKSGIKTSEFWVMLGVIAGVLAPLAWAALDKHPEIAGWIAVVIGAVAAVFAGMRTWLKMEAARQVNILSDEQETTLDDVLDRIEELARQVGKPLSVLLLGVLLFAGGCSPSVEKWGQYSQTNLDELRLDIASVYRELAEKDGLVAEQQLDDHYSDFYGPDGQPATLSVAQLQGKRKALSLIEKTRDEQREFRRGQLAVLEAKADRVTRGIDRIRSVNRAWWRVFNDPENQAVMDRILTAVERLERKQEK